MDKDNKIVLGAVLILLVGMLSFNFNSLTGKAVTGPVAMVTVNPSELYFTYDDLNIGNKIAKVTINLNDKVDNELQLYRKTETGEERVGGFKETICKGTATYCSKGIYTVNYKFSSLHPEGEYFFKVQKRDTSTKEREAFNSNVFSVTHYTAPYRG